MAKKKDNLIAEASKIKAEIDALKKKTKSRRKTSQSKKDYKESRRKTSQSKKDYKESRRKTSQSKKTDKERISRN
jgi:hypothetical protein